MARTYKRTITRLLREIGFHPDFVADMRAKNEPLKRKLLNAHGGDQVNLKVLLRKGDPTAREYWRNAYDARLMEQDFFIARVKFLEHIASFVRSKGGYWEILDDGCGSGVDLYCLSHILEGHANLNGVEPNEHSAKLARERNPGLVVLAEPDGMEYDLVYGDFFSLMDNTPSGNKKKSEQYAASLRQGRHLMQNADFYGPSESLFRGMMQANFTLLSKELLRAMPNSPDCYFFDWIRKAS